MRKILYVLGELSDLDIDWLLHAGYKQEIPAGKVLVEQGKQVDALYIVVSGLLRVSLEDVHQRKITQLGSGEIVGEISLMDGRDAVATVTALRDTTLFTVPRDVLVDHLTEDADFAAGFYRAIAMFLADRIRQTVGLIGYDAEIPGGAGGKKLADNDLSPALIERLPRARTHLDALIKRLRSI